VSLTFIEALRRRKELCESDKTASLSDMCIKILSRFLHFDSTNRSI
jgi:hypothetical protein